MILSHAKSPSDPTINNQLWYFDKETKTIRSVLTDFCVDGESKPFSFVGVLLLFSLSSVPADSSDRYSNITMCNKELSSSL